MNGETIVTEVSSQNGTSTMTQEDTQFTRVVEADGKTSTVEQSSSLVRIECERFEVSATSIETSSTEDTSLSASTTMALASESTFTATSQDSMELSSTSDMSLSSDANLDAKASSAASMVGTQSTTIGDDSGSTSIKGSGVDVEATGTATMKGEVSVEVEGAMVSLSGDGSVTVQAPSVQLG